MSDWPSFSVIIPTHQRKQLVCEVVRALDRVDYAGPLEIIIVVDGSTDGSAAALRSVGSAHPLHVIEQENRGAAAARNAGATKAEGEILLFIDDDMICDADMVEHHARMYRDGADAVTGEVYLHPDSTQNFITKSVDRWIKLPRPDLPQLPFHVYTGHLSVRRAVFANLGGFDVKFTANGVFGHEDTDFGAKLLTSYRLRHSADAVAYQRYVVGPRESMERVRAAAAADLRFLAKYPQYTRYLLAQRGRSSWKSQLLYRPLSRIPLIPAFMRWLAVTAAEAAVRTRFHSSRWVAYLFYTARNVNYWAQVHRMGGYPSSRSVLILCYHAIADLSADPVLSEYAVPPGAFAAQMGSLYKRGFSFVAPDAFLSFVLQGSPLPKRSVLVTFDDCYEDLLDVARDLLSPRDIPALAFMVTGTSTRTNEWDQQKGAQRLRLLSDAQLQRLASLGVEIGAHSRTHRLMPSLSARAQAAEAAGARKDLAASGLRPARFFAYPYGAKDLGTMAAVKAAGYVAAFGVRSRRVTHVTDRFDIPRVPVLASDHGWRFRAKTWSPQLFDWVDLNLDRAMRIFGRVAGRLG